MGEVQSLAGDIDQTRTSTDFPSLPEFTGRALRAAAKLTQLVWKPAPDYPDAGEVDASIPLHSKRA